MQSDRRLFVILFIILVINIVLLGKVGDLNNQLQSLRHDYINLQSSISSISGNVNSTLDRFTKEQTWITQVRVDDRKTQVDGEKGLAVLYWQIRDFREGAEVVFHYRQDETEEFKAVPVQNKGDGFFEVEIPFEIRVEPFWEIGVSSDIQSVTVKLYDGSRLVAEKAMEVREVHDSGKTYRLDYVVDSQDVSHLVIQVKYADGKTFEKEIFI